MKAVEDKEFRKETMVLSGTYRRCSFIECSLGIDGTAVEVVECRFVGCGFRLEGAAVHTLKFLHNMWSSGAWNVVEDLGRDYVGQALRFED